MSELPNPKVYPTPENQEFWDATGRGELLLRRCDDCSSFIWYPRELCPDCHSTNTSWFQASGNGTVYSYTITRKGQGKYREAGPYVLAYVELEEGPRILTNIVTEDPETVSIGQAVTVHFETNEEGHALPRFAPVG